MDLAVASPKPVPSALVVKQTSRVREEIHFIDCWGPFARRMSVEDLGELLNMGARSLSFVHFEERGENRHLTRSGRWRCTASESNQQPSDFDAAMRA